MGMRLFHITDKVFENGDVICSSDFGTACYYHQNSTQYSWINDVLDAGKDAECPQRKRCIYAFDKPGHCLAFVRTTNDQENWLMNIGILRGNGCLMNTLEKRWLLLKKLLLQKCLALFRRCNMIVTGKWRTDYFDWKKRYKALHKVNKIH